MQNITLNALLDLFVFRLKWLLIGLVCGALLASAYTVFFVEDEYTASVSMYVQNTEEDSGVATSSNLSASRMLTNSYAIILQDVETLKLAAENMTVPATMSDIANALTISTSEDSAIIIIHAKTSDAVLSQAICQAVCDVAPEMLHDTVGAGTVTALGDVPPATKTGPNVVRNALLGGLAGLLLTALVVFILYLTDTTVKQKEDLRRITDLPLLGEIPTLNPN